MMITKERHKMHKITGDVLDSFLYENTIIVHGCNAQGVMGSGMAKAVKARFPQAFNDYHEKYQEQGNQLYPGQIIISEVLPTRYIINAITQKYYGTDKGHRYVDYDAVRECFELVRDFAEKNGVDTINYPMIGAGLGGGDWGVISGIIDDVLDGLNHFVWVP